MAGTANAIAADALIGRRVSGITCSWYVDKGARLPEPQRVWLWLEGLGSVQCGVGPSGNDVILTIDEPHDPYEMPELEGAVELDQGASTPLAALVGDVITRVDDLFEDTYGTREGFVLTTEECAVAIVNLGDELVIGAWPDERWQRAGVARRI